MKVCNSCSFPIGEKETVKECESCSKPLHSFCSLEKDGKRVCDPCYVLKVEEKAVFELPEHIRRTHIETYRSCPNKFKLEVLDGHRMPDNPYTRVGSDLHELFEKAIQDRSYPIEQMQVDYLEYEKAHLEEGLYKDEEEYQKFKLRASTSITNFYSVVQSIPPAHIVEETVRYSLGDDIPDVSFTMDLITINENGNWDLHDWKTGKVMVGQKISSDLQAPLYIYGVQKHYGVTVDSFTFYYLNEGKQRRFDRVNDLVYECKVGKRSYYINLEDYVKEIRKIFGQIKKGNFNIPQDTKKMYFTCKMCHLQEQGLCSGADNETWYQMNGGKY